MTSYIRESFSNPISMKLSLLFTALISLALSASAQQSPFMTNIDGEYQTLAQRMEFHKVNGASVAIFRDFELDTTIQLGYRDREHDLLVDRNTQFQLGSMTAAVVKFAIVRLVNDGKIDLDAPANDYLRSWKIGQKWFTRISPVSVRDLLLEKRGFNPVYKPTGYLPGAPIPTWEQIMAGEAPSNLEALPLKRSIAFNSSLANEMILQRILEDIYQQQLPQILEEQVFQPLGMDHSIIRAGLSSEEAQSACIGYDDQLLPIEGGRRVYPEIAHSGLWTTPEDFGTFVLHIFKAANGMDNSLLSQELAIASVKAQRGNNALILLEKKKDGGSYWGGAPKGFYSQFAGSLEEGWIVVGCSNRELAWQFINWELNGRSIEYARRQ